MHFRHNNKEKLVPHYLGKVKRLIYLKNQGMYGRPKPPKFKFFKPTNLLMKSVNHLTLSIN